MATFLPDRRAARIEQGTQDDEELAVGRHPGRRGGDDVPAFLAQHDDPL